MTAISLKSAFAALFFCLLLIVVPILIGRSIPTGDTIAYLKHPEQQITWSIIVRDLDRALSYDLTQFVGMTGVRNRIPAWSPDGTHIAFLSERSGGLDIFVVDLANHSLIDLTSTGEIITSLDWSPDGEQIVFDLTSQTGERVLYQVDVETRETSKLLARESTYDILPKWSSQGDIAFISNRNSSSDVYLWQAGEVRRLTFDLAVTGSVAWSPDGSQLAFTAIDLTPSNAQIIYTDIYLYDLPQPGVRSLGVRPLRIELSGNESDLVWSPDGTQIAFVNDQNDDEIYVMSADGRNPQRLTDNYYPDYAPVWSPDSSRLLWVAAPDYGTSELYMIDLPSRQVEQLTHNRIDDWYPVWRP